MRVFLLILILAIPATADPKPSASPPPLGSIKGVVKFEGKLIPPKPVVMNGDPYCVKYYAGKKPALRQRWVWGKNGTLQNVLVYVSKGLPVGKKYAAPMEPARLAQRGCMYEPHVQRTAMSRLG